MIRSYLTGEMVPVSQGNRRPLAIMMSNDKAALPQYGINRAGVVYEAPVEATMNRYLAIMDYDDLTRIGSVRSCRTYYVYFAREFDAIYAHFGQSTFAKPYLKFIDNINGLKDREARLISVPKIKNLRTTPMRALRAFSVPLRSWATARSTMLTMTGISGLRRKARKRSCTGADVREAYKVTPGYKLNNPWFEYHEDDGLYYRFQYGGPHMGSEDRLR